MNWNEKLDILNWIAHGLNKIHCNGLIHHDFHCGNILNHYNAQSCITDLGLCQPANEKPSQSDNNKIYGVLPYVAPETPSLSTSILSYTTHPQAVYTSRLLDFKNLPEPKNVEDDFLEDYSGN